MPTATSGIVASGIKQRKDSTADRTRMPMSLEEGMALLVPLVASAMAYLRIERETTRLDSVLEAAGAKLLHALMLTVKRQWRIAMAIELQDV